MSGHVPKFGAPKAGGFTEVFTLARGAGKGGSGDSQPDESGRGGGRAAAAAPAPVTVPPRRGSDGASTRSSQEGSGRPSPPVRREPRDPSARSAGVRTSQEREKRAAPPRNMNEEYAGASHLPKFGEWNAGEGETNYTVMFTAASKERKTGVATDDAPIKSSGDSYSNSSRLPKKQSSCWPCF